MGMGMITISAHLNEESVKFKLSEERKTRYSNVYRHLEISKLENAETIDIYLTTNQAKELAIRILNQIENEAITCDWCGSLLNNNKCIECSEVKDV